MVATASDISASSVARNDRLRWDRRACRFRGERLGRSGVMTAGWGVGAASAGVSTLRGGGAVGWGCSSSTLRGGAAAWLWCLVWDLLDALLVKFVPGANRTFLGRRSGSVP